LRFESNNTLINTLKSGISFRNKSQHASGSESGSQDEDENQDKMYGGTFGDTNGRGSQYLKIAPEQKQGSSYGHTLKRDPSIQYDSSIGYIDGPIEQPKPIYFPSISMSRRLMSMNNNE